MLPKLISGCVAATAGLLLATVPMALAQEETDVAQSFDPEAIVLARQGLKAQVAAMQAEVQIAIEDGDDEALYYLLTNLSSIAATLDAFPYLFPSSTTPDALAAAGASAPTSASPAIWEDFPAFQGMAQSVATQARLASEVNDFDALIDASNQLWASCTACHDSYLVYDPFAGMGDVDVDIDLDSLF